MHEISWTPNTSMQQVLQPPTSKSTPLYSCYPTLSNDISTPRSGSIEWTLMEIVVITTLVLYHSSPLSSRVPTRAVSLQKFSWTLSHRARISHPLVTSHPPVGENFQIYRVQITRKCICKSKHWKCTLLLTLTLRWDCFRKSILLTISSDLATKRKVLLVISCKSCIQEKRVHLLPVVALHANIHVTVGTTYIGRDQMLWLVKLHLYIF